MLLKPSDRSKQQSQSFLLLPHTNFSESSSPYVPCYRWRLHTWIPIYALPSEDLYLHFYCKRQALLAEVGFHAFILYINTKKSISEKQDVNIKFTRRTYFYSQIQIMSLQVDRKQIALSTIALIKLPSILSRYTVQDSISILWPSHGSSKMPRDFWIYRARSWLTVLLLQKYRGGKTKII